MIKRAKKRNNTCAVQQHNLEPYHKHIKGRFCKKDARKAFALSLSEIDYKEYDYLSSPKGYVPPSCTAGGKSYTEQCAATVDAKDKEEAIELWKKR